MKLNYKFFVFCLIFLPIVAYAGGTPVYIPGVSMQQACTRYSGNYNDVLEVGSSSVPAQVSSFLKRGSIVYYATQEKVGINIYDKQYNLYAYSCRDNKTSLVVDNKVFNKVFVKKSDIYSDIRIISVKDDIINVGLYPDGVGCVSENVDEISCDFGYISSAINTKKRLIKTSHVFDFSPDTFMSTVRY